MKSDLDIKKVDAQLKAVFPQESLEWRVGSTFKNGRALYLPYVTARAIMERLDEVFDPDGWEVTYDVHENGVIARLICCGYYSKGEKITGVDIKREDGAGYTKIEPLKGGISGALKRAASAMGIGRYLYNLPKVIVDLDKGAFYGKIILPDEYVPENERIGNHEIKVLRQGEELPPKVTKGELTDAVKVALNFVVREDKYNIGKKMSVLSEKALYFLARGRDKEQAQAAKIVAMFKGYKV